MRRLSASVTSSLYGRRATPRGRCGDARLRHGWTVWSGPSGGGGDTRGGGWDVARMTVTDVITSYLDHLAVERGTARNTLDGYARDLRRYEQHLATLGVPSLETVSEAHVSAFLA